MHLITNVIRTGKKQNIWTRFSLLHFTLRALSCQKMADLNQSAVLTEADDTNSQGQTAGRSFRDIYNLSSVNLQLTDDSTPFCAKVIHPGLTPDSIGRNGHPTLWSILKTASSARIFAMHMPTDESGKSFFEYEQLTAGAFTFMSSSLVNISPHMYNRSVPRWPLEVKVEGGHIGRTSLSTVTTMVSPSDLERKELMNQINQVVLVSKETRRPIPIADKWRDLYGPRCIRNEPLIIKPQGISETGVLHEYEVKIAWSDTDNYNHTNFASYPRFALDAIHDGLRHSKLNKHVLESDFVAGVSQVKMAYLGESVEGDLLRIRIWCPENSQRTVVCSMDKEGQNVNQVTLTFFSGSLDDVAGNRKL